MGENFLIPVDGKLASKPAVAKNTFISLDFLMGIVADARPKSIPIICILDCCRTEAEGDQSSARGDLVKTGGSQDNIFIMYATAHRSAANEGEIDGNGAFTARLLKYMDSEMTIEEVAKAIVKDLRKDLKRAQVGLMFKAHENHCALLILLGNTNIFRYHG